jgi:hypothetical protein
MGYHRTRCPRPGRIAERIPPSGEVLEWADAEKFGSDPMGRERIEVYRAEGQAEQKGSTGCIE